MKFMEITQINGFLTSEEVDAITSVYYILNDIRTRMDDSLICKTDDYSYNISDIENAVGLLNNLGEGQAFSIVPLIQA